MEIIHERCCGLDVHKRVVAACVLIPGPDNQPHKELRTFGTMSEDVERLADWLSERGVSQVVLESTGSYWKPVWNILEERGFGLVLANAQHVKQVPGRKTDVRLRHEVVQVAVGPGQPGPNRVFCHSYPTEACN